MIYFLAYTHATSALSMLRTKLM